MYLIQTQLQLENAKNDTLFFIGVGTIVFFVILYLVVRTAVKDANSDLLEEIRKIKSQP